MREGTGTIDEALVESEPEKAGSQLRVWCSTGDYEALKQTLIALSAYHPGSNSSVVTQLIRQIGSGQLALCPVGSDKDLKLTIDSLTYVKNQLVRMHDPFGPPLRGVVKGYRLARKARENSSPRSG